MVGVCPAHPVPGRNRALRVPAQTGLQLSLPVVFALLAWYSMKYQNDVKTGYGVIKEDSGTVRSVIKALAALEFVVEESMTRPGVGLSEIAAALEIQPTTARNILKTMELAGYIDRAERRLYVPGGKCFGMSRAAMIAGRLNKVMAPRLAELAREGGESLVLTTLFNGRRKVLLRNQGDSPVVVDIRNAELERSGCELVTTRIMLAYAAASELELYLRRNGFPKEAWDGIADRAALDRALEALRRAGYAEMIGGEIYAAAFPLLDGAGMLLGALGVFLPVFRLSVESKEAVFGRIRETLRMVREEF